MPTPELAAVEQHSLALPDEARALVIASDPDYQAACLFLRERIKAVLREADAAFDPIIKAAHTTHREAVAQKARVVAPTLEAERIAKAAISGYLREQERLRLAEHRAAQERARALAETEALERAAHAERLGKVDKAIAILEAPLRVPPVVPATPAPKAAGVSIRETWRAEVVDLGALVGAVAADPSKLNLLLPNMPALNALARALKANLILPGVDAVSADSVASR